MGVTVEVLPDAGAPQVGVTVTGLDAGAPSVVSVERSWDNGGTWHGVRGAKRAVVTGAYLFRDFIPPLNTPTRYRVVVHSGAVTPFPLEATITVASKSAWIQDPLNPRAAVALDGVTLGGSKIALMRGTGAALTRRQAVDTATVEGSRYPVASVGQRQAPSRVPLALRALAAEQGELVRTMRRLLDEAGQLVLRGLPPEIPLDPVAHVTAGDVTEVPVVGGLLGFRNDWELVVDQVRPSSLRVVIPWWTYDQVAALWAGRSYADVVAARPGATYLDWLRDPTVP
jgi:hypothetical protein